MAYRRVSLPRLKLTKRPTVGQPSHEFAYGDVPAEPSYAPCDCEETGSHDGEEMMDFASDASAEPTLHELESRATAAGWQKIRQDILNVLTEINALPPDQVGKNIFNGCRIILCIIIELHELWKIGIFTLPRLWISRLFLFRVL